MITSSGTPPQLPAKYDLDHKTGFRYANNVVALQQKLNDPGVAWKRHFDDLAKLKAGKIKEIQFEKPCFRKRNQDHHHSIRIMPFSKYCKVENRRVKLPGKPGWVKFRKPHTIEGEIKEGEIKNCTITRKSGHWFISFQTGQELPVPVQLLKSGWFGYGFARFVTLFSGEQ